MYSDRLDTSDVQWLEWAIERLHKPPFAEEWMIANLGTTRDRIKAALAAPSAPSDTRTEPQCAKCEVNKTLAGDYSDAVEEIRRLRKLLAAQPPQGATQLLPEYQTEPTTDMVPLTADERRKLEAVYLSGAKPMIFAPSDTRTEPNWKDWVGQLQHKAGCPRVVDGSLTDYCLCGLREFVASVRAAQPPQGATREAGNRCPECGHEVWQHFDRRCRWSGDEFVCVCPAAPSEPGRQTGGTVPTREPELWAIEYQPCGGGKWDLLPEVFTSEAEAQSEIGERMKRNPQDGRKVVGLVRATPPASVPSGSQTAQLCPECHGQKYVNTPPHVAGNQPNSTAWADTYPCCICGGSGFVVPPSSARAQPVPPDYLALAHEWSESAAGKEATRTGYLPADAADAFANWLTSRRGLELAL